MNETVLDRLLRYVKIDTQSSEESETYPSTAKQFDLLNLLVAELNALGLSDVSIDKYGYVMATLPSNVPQSDKAFGKVPNVGFISHVDTSPSASGANVKPQVFTYKGGDIVLPGDPSVIIKESENKELKNNIGKTIVTTDGTTLLGADDKAGLAIIMTAMQTLLNNPNLIHGDIKVGFTPDEEIGAGTKYFDIKKFGAQFAYTVDGDSPGELNKETFSANAAIITVHGRNIHPGSAKNIMVNSIKIMADIITRLPKNMSPETTEGYEPYLHPHVLKGEEEKTTLNFLLRDFNTEGLDTLKKKLEQIIEEVKPLHPKARIELDIREQYRNMREGCEKDVRVLDCLFEAAKRSGFEPKWVPIRGGTDGSKLTAAGLPCPNIFTGGQNYHGKTEWASVWGMEKAVETVVNLAQVWVEKSR
ncbi:MAG: peptidase T [Bacteroidetes bacterium]|nr:MAG: peptidase T [Bacteroidota bacterium]